MNEYKTVSSVFNGFDEQKINLLTRKEVFPLSRPNFHSSSIFNENLVAIQLKKLKVLINKPTYVGFCVLDISKTLMYNFHYNYMCKLCKNKCKLNYSDTDSHLYDVKCDDFYEDIKKILFTLTDLTIQWIIFLIYLKLIKKILGKFKDECNSQIIIEFVGLRSKMYCFRMYEKNEDSKKFKGIRTSVVNDSISFNDFLDCLFNFNIHKREQYMIRS